MSSSFGLGSFFASITTFSAKSAVHCCEKPSLAAYCLTPTVVLSTAASV